MILAFSSTSDLATDLLIARAAQRKIEIIRFNTDQYPDSSTIAWESPTKVKFTVNRGSFTVEDISAAWHRVGSRAEPSTSAEALFTARESQGFLSGLLNTAAWPWMNHPIFSARAENKLYQLDRARALELTVPETLIGNDSEAIRDFIRAGPTIAKTIVGPRVDLGDQQRAVYTTSVRLSQIGHDAELAACPVIWQRQICGGVDIRVTVVGNVVFPIEIRVLNRTEEDVDWRALPQNKVQYATIQLPQEIEQACIKLLKTMDLQFGAIDLIVDSHGCYHFLEINPAGQWGWIEERAKTPITDAILDHLQTMAGGA